MSLSVLEVAPAEPAVVELLDLQGREPDLHATGPLWKAEVPGAAHPLPPSLQINPIGAAHRPASRVTSFALSLLAWGVATGGCLLVYHLQSVRTAANRVAPPSVSILLMETDNLNVDGGGHQGGGAAPPAAKAPEPEAAPPPPPPRDLPADLPTPTTLPTAPVAAPPVAAAAAGVPGGTGTGSGIGTGSGSGTGTGSGTGSGQGAGSGVQSQEPLVVPYSQIGFVKVINPTYPENARRVGLEGQVVVRVTIDEEGKPFAFHVVGGESIFIKETLRVLPHWRFTPVTHKGHRVKATFDAVLRFNLA